MLKKFLSFELAAARVTHSRVEEGVEPAKHFEWKINFLFFDAEHYDLRERNVLYPWLDRITSNDERRALLAKFSGEYPS